MEDHRFDILDEGRRVRIDGQVYQPIANAELAGAMRCQQTGQTVLIQRYPDMAKAEVEDQIKQIIGRYYRGHYDSIEIHNDLDRLIEDARRQLKDVTDDLRFIVPDGYTMALQPDGMYTVYTYSRLPERAVEQCHVLSRVVSAQKEVSVMVRTLTARWLSIELLHLYDLFHDQLYSILPEDVLVDITTGEVWIVLGRCFMASSMILAPDPHALYYIRCCGTQPLPEHEFVRFAAYSCFRLLLGGDPYDGRYTLANYPLLTERVLWKLHRNINEAGRTGEAENEPSTTNLFTCANPVNEQSVLINYGLRDRFKRLPAFIQEDFKKKTLGVPQSSLSLQAWVKEMYLLYDCLIYDARSKRFSFCDPEKSHSFQYLRNSLGYRIPICHGKGIYWYHIGDCSYMDRAKGVQDGRVGVFYERGDAGSLRNKTYMTWRVKAPDGTVLDLPPDGEVMLCLHMVIEIGEVRFEVIGGIADDDDGLLYRDGPPASAATLPADGADDVPIAGQGETA